MARYIISPIGRMVDNYWDYDKDLILKTLFDWHRDMFNKEDIPLRPMRLAEHIGGFDIERLKDICKKLSEEGLVEEIKVGHNVFYRISPRGIELVERLVKV